MHVDAHVASLEQKHAHLEDAITVETNRPVPNNLRLSELKKAKLKLKEEIRRFSS